MTQYEWRRGCCWWIINDEGLEDVSHDFHQLRRSTAKAGQSDDPEDPDTEEKILLDTGGGDADYVEVVDAVRYFDCEEHIYETLPFSPPPRRPRRPDSPYPGRSVDCPRGRVRANALTLIDLQPGYSRVGVLETRV